MYLRIMFPNFLLANAWKGATKEDRQYASRCALLPLMASPCPFHIWLRKSSWRKLEVDQKSDGKEKQFEDSFY